VSAPRRGRDSRLSCARLGRHLVLLGLLVLPSAEARAVTLEELLAEPDLGPKPFAAHFSAFEYAFFERIQPAEQFLRTERGDCDDYAALADHVFRQRGIATKLVHVRLVGRVAHVVCYVDPDGVYLDYNDRSYFFKVTRSRGSLRAIANQVADSFDANWTTVSEFTYDYASDRKRIVRTVVKAAPSENDSDREKTN
jgi:hypothetical protein